MMYKNPNLPPLIAKSTLTREESQILCKYLFQEIEFGDLNSIERYLLSYMGMAGSRGDMITRKAKMLAMLTRLTASTCYYVGASFDGGKVAVFNELQVQILEQLHNIKE